MWNKCQVIGVLDNGLDGLSTAALEMLKQAEVVIAATRVLALFAAVISTAESKNLTGNLGQVPEWINSALEQQKKLLF